ncbi:MAG: hypothetical protein KDC38_13135 [Planctomycetes bacterium]|nr:hypothetical protein [Planctomycetota bacterium]
MRGLVLAVVLLAPTLRLAAEPPDPKPECDDVDFPELSGLEKKDAKNAVEKLLDDIQGNLQDIEELLERRDTSVSTQKLQAKSVELIEKLIEEANKT